MPRKGLTRGDGLAFVSVLLIFIFSFMPYYKLSSDSSGGNGFNSSSDSSGHSLTFNAWTLGFQPLGATVVLLPVIAFLLLMAGRFVARPEQHYMGLSLRQWATAFGVVGTWSVLWSLGGAYGNAIVHAESGHSASDLGLHEGHEYGAWVILAFSLIFGLLLLCMDSLPGLAAPLAATPQPYPGYGPVPPQGYATPSGMYTAQLPMPPAPGMPVTPPTVPPGTPLSMMPPPTMAGGVPVAAAAPAAPPAAAPAGEGPEPEGDFAQFWFAVPAPRQVLPSEGLDKTPVAELVPGTWYLAVAPHPEGVVVEVNGNRGVVQDLSGIQRGE